MNDVVEVEAVLEVEAMTRADARALEVRITASLEDATEALAEAYVKEAWKVLGYDSWQVFCETVMDGTAFKLKEEALTEAIEAYEAAGMSNRQIAAATGWSEGTIRNQKLKAAGTPRPSKSATVKGYISKALGKLEEAPEWEPTELEEVIKNVEAMLHMLHDAASKLTGTTFDWDEETGQPVSTPEGGEV